MKYFIALLFLSSSACADQAATPIMGYVKAKLGHYVTITYTDSTKTAISTITYSDGTVVTVTSGSTTQTFTRTQ